MPRFLDSSVLVRYLTNDDPRRARTAEAIIESDELVLTCVILSEVAYVLHKGYGQTRRDITATLAEFLLRANVQTIDAPKELVAAALMRLAENARLSFGDALIVAHMQGSGHEEIYSFDSRFREGGIRVLDAPVSRRKKR